MRRRSERSRWVQIFGLSEPHEANEKNSQKNEFQKARAVVTAFERVGRVVRVETDGLNGLVFKARKA